MHNFMNNRFIFSRYGIAITFVSLILWGTVSSAFAADTKTYPGHACNYKTTPDGVEYSSQGWIVNDSTEHDRRVVCAIVRDEMIHTGLNDVKIYYTNSGGGTLTCNVHNRSQNGGAGGFKTKSTSVSGPGVFDFDPVDDYAPWGHYTIDCVLPKRVGSEKSRIRSYIVHEERP